MNAFRTIRTLSLILLVALLAINLTATSATAGGNCYSPKYCGPSYYSSNYCYPTYTNYCNYGFDYSCFQPAVSYCAPQQYCFPVTTYDCYGRPTIVWQTSYGQTIYNASLPVKFAQ
jgi:hypothetical protein